MNDCHLVHFLLIFTYSETSCFLMKNILKVLLLGIWPSGYFTSFKGIFLNSKALAYPLFLTFLMLV